MAKVAGKAYDINLLKRVFEYVSPYKNSFGWSVALTIILAIVAPMRPLLIQYTLDKHIFTDNYEGLLNITLLMLGLLILQTIAQYYHTYITNTLGQSTVRDLRIAVFNHITKLKLRYFDRTPIGQLITRTVSDLETISEIFSEGLIVIIGDILQLLIILGIMLFIDWELTLVVLAPMPLLILASYVFKEAIKSAFQDVRTQVGNLNTFLQEHISGMSIIKYFARENQEMRKFKQINARHRDANIRSNWYYSIFFPVVEIISALSIGLLVWYGSKQIILHEITPGTIVLFIMFVNMMFRPIRELADKFNTLQMGMVGAERVFSVLDHTDTEENTGHLVPANLKGEISFENVWFTYQPDQEGDEEPNWILKDISFSIKPGETLALASLDFA